MRRLAQCIALPACLLALAAPLRADCDASAIDQHMQAIIAAGALPGAGIMLGTPQGVFHERYYGSYHDGTVVAVASASKLLAGVRVMHLVDSATLTLDTPVSTWLPQFTGIKGTMTARQMFSHTAGYGGPFEDQNAVLSPSYPSLAAAADRIACCEPLSAGVPGGQFAYGGIAMHITGRVVEVLTGQDWNQGWQQHMGQPLAIASISWSTGTASTNYRIAGGARSSLPDYARVLEMLLNRGVGNGQRVLTEAAVTTLSSDQTIGLPVVYAPPSSDGSGYGIGTWIDPPSATTTAPSIFSPGSFGFTPWVDFQSGHYGAILVRGGAGFNGVIDADTDAIRALARDLALSGTCPPIRISDPVFRDDFD